MHSIIEHPNYKSSYTVYGQKIMEVCSWHNLIRERGLSEALRPPTLSFGSFSKLAFVTFRI